MEKPPATTVKTFIRANNEFGKYVTHNLDGKKFRLSTPFGFKSDDEVVEIDGKDVRQWDENEVQRLLKKGQSMFGHVFCIMVARPSGSDFEKIMSADQVMMNMKWYWGNVLHEFCLSYSSACEKWMRRMAPVGPVSTRTSRMVCFSTCTKHAHSSPTTSMLKAKVTKPLSKS